jgi:hypothetical protein
MTGAVEMHQQNIHENFKRLSHNGKCFSVIVAHVPVKTLRKKME